MEEYGKKSKWSALATTVLSAVAVMTVTAVPATVHRCQCRCGDTGTTVEMVMVVTISCPIDAGAVSIMMTKATAVMDRKACQW
jgi:hypothetical protein